MKALGVGGGGREHASCWKLAQSPKVTELYSAPGNGGIAQVDQSVHIKATDVEAMVAWAKDNARISGLSDAPLRRIEDDCAKIVENEIRRSKTYDAIIMDPPSYGRGPKGEIWKIEESIHPFIKLCTQLLSDDPLFFLVNS